MQRNNQPRTLHTLYITAHITVRVNVLHDSGKDKDLKFIVIDNLQQWRRYDIRQVTTAGR
jgi:hypothetical protein